MDTLHSMAQELQELRSHGIEGGLQDIIEIDGVTYRVTVCVVENENEDG